MQRAAFKYRDRLTIIVDILRAVNERPQGKRKTGIMQTANLSSPQMEKYLNLLLITELLREEDNIYKPTERGRQLAKDLESIYQSYKDIQVSM
jgi:predicted transcriptional regulator